MYSNEQIEIPIRATTTADGKLIATQPNQAENMQKYYENMVKPPAIELKQEEIEGGAALAEATGGSKPEFATNDMSNLTHLEEDKEWARRMVAAIDDERPTPTTEEAIQQIEDIVKSVDQQIELIKNALKTVVSDVLKPAETRLNKERSAFEEHRASELAKINEGISKLEADRKTIDEAKEMIEETKEAMQESGIHHPTPAPIHESFSIPNTQEEVKDFSLVLKPEGLPGSQEEKVEPELPEPSFKLDVA